jgi:hypothetical protein
VSSQQAHTQAVPLVVTIVVVLVAVAPEPVTVPGSPEPWSPDVSCHGVGPSSMLAVLGLAASDTLPLATHTACVPDVDRVLPATETEHHEK